MSDERPDGVPPTARDEAAERGRTSAAGTLARLARDVRDHRAAGTVIVVVGLAVVALGALGLDRLGATAPPVASPSASAAPTAPASPGPTPTPGAEPTAVTTPAPSPSPTPAVTVPASSPTPGVVPPPPTPGVVPTTSPPAEDPSTSVPGQVTVVDAGPSGGSGEIGVSWDAIGEATGYRVYRSAAPDGPFEASASVDVASGATTIEWDGPYEYVQIWLPTPQTVEYVEASIGDVGYFRVAAFSAAGEGPPSVVVCGRPIGYPDC